MDATVTAKFFRVTKPAADAPNTETILQALHDKELVHRERSLDEGVVLRLERLEVEPNYLSGEFCRIQKTNIPPTAGDDGVTPTILEDGKGLGHMAAFRYHLPTRILLLQMNQLCATANRVSLYLGLAENKPFYHLEPVLRTDALTRMKKAEVKAFSVTFAEPQNMEMLDDEALSALKGVKRAAKLLHANEIEIRIAAGPKKKKKKAPHMLQLPVRVLLAKLSKGGDEIKSLKAQISEEEQAQWIDLLEEQIKETERLNLPSDDTEENYQLRKSFITNFFNANIAELKKLYGPSRGNP